VKIFVTGSSGLIGSELVSYFDQQGETVVGADSNMRAYLFGPEGDTSWRLRQLQESTHHFFHHGVDVRDRSGVTKLLREEGPFDLIVHCAAQPSHDLAALRPLDDFDINAVGTLNVLEAARQHSPEAVFIFMSTNKVYGDSPNELPLRELPTRYDYALGEGFEGIGEGMRIDRSIHSVFGASKVAADVMVQEYGRYFGMRTTCLRCGCLTGPNQAGVELHGFLSFLVKTQLQGRTYQVFGYSGKQVRDNIHSFDLARAIEAIARCPRVGEVYNMGGGRRNSCSILEALDRVEQLTGCPMRYELRDEPRRGDHMCYITDLRKFSDHYGEWSITRSIDDIFDELVRDWRDRLIA